MQGKCDIYTNATENMGDWRIRRGWESLGLNAKMLARVLVSIEMALTIFGIFPVTLAESLGWPRSG